MMNDLQVEADVKCKIIIPSLCGVNKNANELITWSVRTPTVSMSEAVAKIVGGVIIK
mgnify:CR=1 FL=1|jgi:hypothetical protein